MKYRIYWQIAALFLIIQSITAIASLTQLIGQVLVGNLAYLELPAFYIIGSVLSLMLVIALLLWALRNGFSTQVRYPDDNSADLDYTLFTAVLLCIMGCYLFIINISQLIHETFLSIQFWDDSRGRRSIGDLLLGHLDLWILCLAALILIFMSKPIATFLVARARGTETAAAEQA